VSDIGVAVSQPPCRLWCSVVARQLIMSRAYYDDATPAMSLDIAQLTRLSRLTDNRSSRARRGWSEPMSRPSNVSLVVMLRRWSHMSALSVSRWVHANATYAGLVDRRQTRIRRPSTAWPWRRQYASSVRRSVRVTPIKDTDANRFSSKFDNRAICRSVTRSATRLHPAGPRHFVMSSFATIEATPTTDRCCQRAAITVSGSCMTPTVTSPRLIWTDRGRSLSRLRTLIFFSHMQ